MAMTISARVVDRNERRLTLILIAIANNRIKFKIIVAPSARKAERTENGGVTGFRYRRIVFHLWRRFSARENKFQRT